MQLVRCADQIARKDEYFDAAQDARPPVLRQLRHYAPATASGNVCIERSGDSAHRTVRQVNNMNTGLSRSLAAALTVLAMSAISPDGASRAADTNWYSHGGTHDESNYSELDQINTQTIGRLGLAWSLDLEGEVSLEATPLAIDGKLYFTGSAS